MSDRRGYCFPTTDLDQGSQWAAGSQHPPRYPAGLSAYQGVPASAYPTMAGAAHNMAPVHPFVQCGVNDYAGAFPPSVLSQYIAVAPNAYVPLTTAKLPPSKSRLSWFFADTYGCNELSSTYKLSSLAPLQPISRSSFLSGWLDPESFMVLSDPSTHPYHRFRGDGIA